MTLIMQADTLISNYRSKCRYKDVPWGSIYESPSLNEIIPLFVKLVQKELGFNLTVEDCSISLAHIDGNVPHHLYTRRVPADRVISENMPVRFYIPLSDDICFQINGDNFRAGLGDIVPVMNEDRCNFIPLNSHGSKFLIISVPPYDPALDSMISEE